MSLIVLIATAFFAGVALAADGQPLSRTVEKWQDKRASELIGAKALDRQGEILGRIEDLILASQTGTVHYAVVSFGGRLGLGDRHYIYPVQALAPGRGPNQVVIEVDKKDLGKRTGVAELETWLRQYDPNASIADRRYVRATELLGKGLDDRGGQRIGEVEDLVVNLGSGRLRFVVVELAQPREGDRLRALPFDLLAVPILRDRHLALR